MAEKGHASQHLSKTSFNLNSLAWKSIRCAWKELREGAVKADIPEKDVISLRGIITILAGTQCNFGYRSEDGGSTGTVYLSVGIHRSWRALHEFLTNYAGSAKYLYISGTLVEPRARYFSELSGKEVKPVIYPDIRKATGKLP